MRAPRLRLLDPPPIDAPGLTPAPPAEPHPVLLAALAAGLVAGLLAVVVADHRLSALDAAVGEIADRLARVEAGG